MADLRHGKRLKTGRVHFRPCVYEFFSWKSFFRKLKFVKVVGPQVSAIRQKINQSNSCYKYSLWGRPLVLNYVSFLERRTLVENPTP